MGNIELRDVTKVYDDPSGMILAVEDLDLEVRDGEFLVIVGPSGCGKSTTLRMIAGLESITDGEIAIDGEVINEKPPKDRDIAMVFQNYALYPHKTVRGNMAYGLQLSTDLEDEEIIKRVETAAEMMGIEDLLDKKPAALSGGQQQRVATGRAIVREPGVFLFDEPLSNLDAKLRKHMRTELARLHTELGITTVYVTHDQEEAMTMADRIVVMNDGRLQQVGTPKEVYYKPNNVFIADFIGSPSMNLFDVELRENADGSATLVHNHFEYQISESVAANVTGGTSNRFVLGIRPENITVPDDTVSVPDEKLIQTDVDVVETVGSDNFLYLDLGGEEVRVRASITVEPNVNDSVWITFDESQMHLFDAETEETVFHGSEVTDIEARARTGVDQRVNVEEN